MPTERSPCEPFHGRLPAAERAGDVAIDQPGEQQRRGQDDRGDPAELPERGVECRVQVTGVGTGEKDPLPGREPGEARWRSVKVRQCGVGT